MPFEINRYIDTAVLAKEENFEAAYTAFTSSFEQQSIDERKRLLITQDNDKKNPLHHLLSMHCNDHTKLEQFNLNKKRILAYLITTSDSLGIDDYLTLTDGHFGSNALHFAARKLDDTAIEVLLSAGSQVTVKSDNGKLPIDLLFDNHANYDQLALCLKIFIRYLQQKNLYLELYDLKQKIIDYLHQYYTQEEFYSVKKHKQETLDPREQALLSLLPILAENETQIKSNDAMLEMAKILDKLKSNQWDAQLVFWVSQALTKLLREQGLDFYCDVIPTDQIEDGANLRAWIQQLAQKLQNEEKLPLQFFLLMNIGAHWFPIVFMLPQNKLNYFVLDSANMSIDFATYLSMIENHLNVFIENSYNYQGTRQAHDRVLQADKDSCSRFSLMHIFCMGYFNVLEQLQKAKTTTRSSDPNYHKIYSEDFEDRLSELLIPAQSKTLLDHLSDEVKYTVVSYDGTPLFDKVSAHIKQDNRNNAIEWYKLFFEKILIQFFAQLTNEQFNLLQANQMQGANYFSLSNPPIWQEDKRSQLIRKVEAISRLMVTSGMGKDSTLMQLLTAARAQLLSAELDVTAIASLDRQTSMLIEKGMRQIGQVQKLILSIAQAIEEVRLTNQDKVFFKQELDSEQQLLAQALQVRDPDKIKALIIAYLQIQQQQFFKLNVFTIALLKQINSHHETRRVFLEAYPILDTASQGLAALQENPEQAKSLVSDQDFLTFLDELTGKIKATVTIPQIADAKSIQEVQAQLNSYFTQNGPSPHHSILHYLQQFEGTQRVQNVQEVMQLIYPYKRTHPQKTELLKKSLASENTLGWKAACFSQYTRGIYREFFHPIKPQIDAQNTIALDETRFASVKSILPADHPESCYAMVGSTFTSNKPQFTGSNKNPHVLDALCMAQHLNHEGEVDGLILALADGCGGHTVDEHDDKNIARSAHFASKHALRLLSCFDDAESVLQARDEIIASLRNELAQKAPLANTTLLFARVFVERDGYRVVGFNIGDGLLCAWNDATQSITTLAPSICTEDGVANFPDSCRKHEVHIIDQRLPLQSHLFIMSDGMVDALPKTVKPSSYSNQVKYNETSLDANGCKQIINSASTAKARVDALLTHVVNVTEQQRQQLTPQQPDQLGDDVSIAVVDMSMITAKPKSQCVIS